MNNCPKCGEPVRSTGRFMNVIDSETVEPTIEYFYCEKCKSYSQEKIK